jgi:hypothetical protein
MMTIAIDWTASLEKEETRGQDPWLSLKTMRPDKHLPQAPLTDYKGTKYDVFTMYLPRQGIAPCEPVRAFSSGHFKMLECRGRLYLTMIDGIMYERNISSAFKSEKELSRFVKIM